MSGDKAPRIEKTSFTVYGLADNLTQAIREQLPAGRERSLALTNIQQGMLWAACADPDRPSSAYLALNAKG